MRIKNIDHAPGRVKAGKLPSVIANGSRYLHFRAVYLKVLNVHLTTVFKPSFGAWRALTSLRVFSEKPSCWSWEVGRKGVGSGMAGVESKQVLGPVALCYQFYTSEC